MAWSAFHLSFVLIITPEISAGYATEAAGTKK